MEEKRFKKTNAAVYPSIAQQKESFETNFAISLFSLREVIRWIFPFRLETLKLRSLGSCLQVVHFRVIIIIIIVIIIIIIIIIIALAILLPTPPLFFFLIIIVTIITLLD